MTTAVFSPLKEKSSPSSSIARGKAIAVGSPLIATRSIAGPARIAEAEEPGDLVERLAGGVVDRLAEQAVLAVVLHLDEHRVAARHEQHDDRAARASGSSRSAAYRWASRWFTRDERHVPHQGQRLGGAHADEQRADQPGADGRRDGVDAVVVDAGLDDRLRRSPG